MKRIFFLTRFWGDDNSGGVLLRKENVRLLKNAGFDVKIASSTPLSDYFVDYNFNQKFHLILQRFGIIEDYLIFWADKLYDKLKNDVQEQDIIYTTTGGELSTLRLGYFLKINTKAKLVIHFHDPILYLTYDNEQFIPLKGFYYQRYKALKKYLAAADLIITTSKTFYNTLINQFNIDFNKIINNYFGYIHKIDDLKIEKKISNDVINIVYGGAFQKLQSPEILAHIVAGNQKVKLTYLGKHHNYKPLDEFRNIKNIEFLKPLSYLDYIKYMKDNADIGFVPLVGNYLKFCVPSKIYELINLGLPILGMLPKGDAMNIININKFGNAFYYNDFIGVKEFINEIINNSDILIEIKNNILSQRDKWHIQNLYQEVISRILQL